VTNCKLAHMAYRIIRRFLVVLSLVAFVGTGLAQGMKIDPIAPSGNEMTMSGMSEAPMPCCPDKAASCITDIGCVFLVGMPVPASTFASRLTWSVVAYRISHDIGEGLSVLPALGPPILLA
jgi:hypothetical protein